ncbi:hypothetical protein ACSFA7_18135 [Variovorax sp. LT1R20]|uniref:hypothetical protein n=1 Tax=Variovorax sp. LT1R20 TaxID=3443729 RepID=UPI003F47E324
MGNKDHLRILPQQGQVLIFMQLDEIKRARDKGDLNVALAACYELLEKDAASIDALRMRASVWFLKDRQTEALQDYQLVIESGLTNAGDFFLGSDVALQLGKIRPSLRVARKGGRDRLEEWKPRIRFFSLLFVGLQQDATRQV